MTGEQPSVEMAATEPLVPGEVVHAELNAWLPVCARPCACK